MKWFSFFLSLVLILAGLDAMSFHFVSLILLSRIAIFLGVVIFILALIFSFSSIMSKVAKVEKLLIGLGLILVGFGTNTDGFFSMFSVEFFLGQIILLVSGALYLLASFSSSPKNL